MIGGLTAKSKVLQADVISLLLTHIFPAFLVLNLLKQYFENDQARKRAIIQICLLGIFIVYILGMDYITQYGVVVNENVVADLW